MPPRPTRHGLVFALLLGLFIAAFPQDSTIILQSDSGAAYAPWQLQDVPGDSQGVQPAATLRGRFGLLFRRGPLFSVTRQFPFQADSWQRFYIRLNEAGSAPPEGKVQDTLFYLHYNYSIRLHKEQPLSFISFLVIRDPAKGRCFLKTSLFPSSDPAQILGFPALISHNREYCIETRVQFQSVDSVDFSLYLDGDSLFSATVGYFYKRSFFFVEAGNWKNSGPGWSFSLDEFTLSGKRPHPLPQPPLSCADSRHDSALTLSCGPFASRYKGETQAATRWRLFTPDEPLFPLFDTEETDPAFFRQSPVPFPLDSGEDLWQVAFKNNFDQWSDWTLPRRVLIPGQRYHTIRFLDAHLEEAGKKGPATTILPGRTYDLVLHLKPKEGWNEMGYVLAMVRHSSFTLGHPGNFGGYSDPEKSYVINLSFETHDPAHPLIFYEKQMGDARPHQVVTTGVPSLFVQGQTPDAVKLDTATGEIRLKMRFLNQARTGSWQLMAVAFDSSGSPSNIVRRRLTLDYFKFEGEHGNSLKLVYAAIILVLATVAFFAIKRKKRTPPKADGDFIRIVDYLKSKLQEDLTTDKVRQDLRYGARQFHKILNKNGVESLPRLLNELRIQKAKELLALPDKNISEIGFDIGFAEARYFTKVFKDNTGQTPTEYRKSLLDRAL